MRIPALPDDEGWDFTALGVALECARWKTLMRRTTSGPLDVLRLNAEIERALGITNSLAEIKKRITASKTQLDGIEEYLDDIKRQLLTSLQQIRDTVAEAQDRPEAA